SNHAIKHNRVAVRVVLIFKVVSSRRQRRGSERLLGVERRKFLQQIELTRFIQIDAANLRGVLEDFLFIDLYFGCSRDWGIEVSRRDIYVRNLFPGVLIFLPESPQLQSQRVEVIKEFLVFQPQAVALQQEASNRRQQIRGTFQ